jgi:hypothetical protein
MGRLGYLVRTDVKEERVAFIISVKRISELERTLSVNTSLIISSLMVEAKLSSETSVPTRATRRHIREDGILQRIRSSPVIKG